VSKEQAVLDAAAALDAVWSERGLGAMGDSTRAMLVGHAFGESQFGRHIPGFKDTLRGTNNWGSVQATQAWQKAHGGTDYFGAAAHLDHRGDGTPYVGYYRIYPNQYEAAKGWLSTVLYAPADFATAIAQGSSAYAQYLRSHGYFEAPVERYVTMLTNGQADMWRTLQAARAHGLKPADPKQAGFNEAPVAPLIERLHTPKGEYSPSKWGTVSAELFQAAKADGEGVRWFGKPLPALAPSPDASAAASSPVATATATGSGGATSATGSAATNSGGAAGSTSTGTATGSGGGGGEASVRPKHSLTPLFFGAAAVGVAALVTEWIVHHRALERASR
jgi:hypothetical protein